MDKFDPKALDLFKQFGNFTMAYSVLVDNEVIKHHIVPNLGLIGYSEHKNLMIMNADPLCAEENLDALVSSFISEGERRGKKLLGIQSGIETAEAFRQYGYSANHMGVETIINIDKFNLTGKTRTKVRRWVNTAKNAGVEVIERKYGDNGISKQAKEVSREWLDSKINTTELNLMTRKSKCLDEYMTRTFFAYKDDRMIGYITFDPMCKDGKVIGYYADICRNRTDVPNGTTDLIVNVAREKFKEEGIKHMSLGISPLSDIDSNHGFSNPIIDLILKVNYNFGNKMYAFNGLEFHKRAYHDGVQSERRPTYFLSKGALPLVEVIDSFAHIGIIQSDGFVKGLLSVGKNVTQDIYEKSVNYFKAKTRC
jgi:lysylphosphatidylglycerol synthetase-like protein (DUF2156 family)